MISVWPKFYVGTEHFKTAPGVYFVRGEYTASTVSLVTQKKILVDCDTRFSRDLIQCADIKVVGTPNHYICDFMLNGNNVGEVHSSWFKTVTAFWGCDAKTLYIDQDNNFANTVLQGNVELNQQNIIGGSRIPMTYAEGKRLQITNCNILGKNLWNSTDQIRFYYSYFKDEWFSDPANIDFVNKVNVRSVGLNKLILDNFSNVQVYVNACRADGQTSIDLQDRKCSSLNLSDFNDVRNVQAASVSLYSSASGGSYDVTLRNSNIDSLGFVGRYLSVSDSDIGFNNQPSAGAMWFENTKITGYSIWTVPMQVECDNCWWGVTMNYVTWFIVLYFISSYIRLYPKKCFNNTLVWGVFTFVSFAISAISVVCCTFLGLGKVFHIYDVYYYFVADSNTLLAVTTGVCSFMFFKNMNVKYNKIINTVAASTFGVLLIHANSDTMRQWLWKDTLNNVGHYSDSLMSLYAFCCVIGVFAVCVLIDIIRIQVFEKPFFKLWDKHWDTFSNWFSEKEKRFFNKLHVN